MGDPKGKASPREMGGAQKNVKRDSAKENDKNKRTRVEETGTWGRS